MAMDIEQQYDKIYRYCYHRLRRRELAEDVTQETFLRFFRTYENRQRDLPLLYTIARHLCQDAARKRREEPLEEEISVETTGDPLQNTALKLALEQLPQEDRELLLMRYVNEESLGVLSQLYGVSRFALYRRCKNLLSQLKREMEG